MTERRFTDKPVLNPYSVKGLDRAHPAMVENRTLFPSTVVTVTATEPARLLVSGENNRKLGKTVAKGAFKGYALFGLTLEERATCPDDCVVRDICYGNGMQLARRHRIGDRDVFFDRLGFEICELLDEHEGLLIRLHVLGDFPDVEYVAFWSDALEENDRLAVYGYTAHKEESEVGAAIAAMKAKFPDRFRIRWSGMTPRPDGAVVVSRIPTKPRIEEGIVCPAQTQATACCASCGLCWEPNARHDSIAFIRHGPKSDMVIADTVNLDAEAVRHIKALNLVPAPKVSDTVPPMPKFHAVAPTSLLIESAYQRDFSARSISLIRKMVVGWDWTKFKPPVCARGPDGLMVIDGQHTAIAAATRGVEQIPVMVVEAEKIESRAASFVSHNRDRLAMSPLQVLHADATALDPVAVGILALAKQTGAVIPRNPPLKGRAKPGTVLSVRDMRRIFTGDGPETLERIFRIVVGAQMAPATTVAVRALRILLTAPLFAPVKRLPDSRLSNALKALPLLESQSRMQYLASGGSMERIAAQMITDQCREDAR